jgi:signal transduction histidine kinase
MTDNTENIQVSEDFLKITFPFYFTFDEALCLQSAGNSLLMLCPSLQQGVLLSDYLQILRPFTATLATHSIRENLKNVFLFRLLPAKIDLKGQIIYVSHSHSFIFLGSPAVKEISELIKAKMTLNDFALHDNTMEFLFIMQAYKQQTDLKLREKNKRLEEQKNEIEAQNEELKQQKEEILVLNNHLEEIVETRTQELNLSVQKLFEQNQNLEQFSYIISHNLRAPLARIMGLLNLFQRQEEDKAQQKEILKYLDQAAATLNEVITDLSEIISIRKSQGITKEIVHIQKAMEAMFETLRDEVKKANATFIIHFEDIETIYTIKSYFQSILYNLVSNAIKYRSDKRNLIIEIKGYQIDNYTCIKFKDNGLGIDLKQYSKEHIFGLYKRLHLHTEGKGLGLYLVKTQIETLKGRIELESEPDIGSIFTVYLPTQEVN